MKILIISNHSYMLYRFRAELIRSLLPENEIVISVPFVGHENDFRAMGIKCIQTDVERRGINPKTDFKLFTFYRRILKQEQPDMVITYSIKPNIYAGLACSIMRIPFCANVQGLGTAFQKRGLAQLVTILYKAAFKKVKTVFFENEGNANVFLKHRIISHQKVTVLPGAGIDLDDYARVPYPDNNAVHFLYLGRIMREKGIDELFAAFRRLHNELGDKVVLDLVGFFDDDYEAQVKQLVDEGLAVFHGFQAEPKPYYAKADCIVLPSYHEGMSNVLLEAAAIGRPVITSNIHGCKEAVDPEISGYLCDAGDANSLYQQMLRMAELGKEERQAMGVAARKKMEQQFEKHMVVQKTIEAIFK